MAACDAGPAQIACVALEAVVYQTRDLIEAMRQDGAVKPAALRVDGGMAANTWLVQFLADMLDIPVERPVVIETTVLGVAYLAGLTTGLYASLDAVTRLWQSERQFTPPHKWKTSCDSNTMPAG